MTVLSGQLILRNRADLCSGALEGGACGILSPNRAREGRVNHHKRGGGPTFKGTAFSPLLTFGTRPLLPLGWGPWPDLLTHHVAIFGTCPPS